MMYYIIHDFPKKIKWYLSFFQKWNGGSNLFSNTLYGFLFNLLQF